MAIHLILLVLPMTLAEISLGSIGGFLSTFEITDTIYNLTVSYPLLFSSPFGSPFEILQMTNVSIFGINKPHYVITGGFYAGNPITTFEVLYMADRLANEYSTNQTIQDFVDASVILFIPVLNSPAYAYMEANYDGISFLEVKTGLEGTTWGCPSYDTGINPDRSFPFNWIFSDRCSVDFGGSQYLESSIANDLNGLLLDIQPVLIVNFQGPSQSVFIPFSSETTELPKNSTWFYDILAEKVPNGWEFVQMSTQEIDFGTLLDYGYTQGMDTLQVGVGNSTIAASDIISSAAFFYDFTVDSLLEDVLNVEISIKSINEMVYLEDTNSSYYSAVNFIYEIVNTKAVDYAFQLSFDPGFAEPEGYTLFLLETSTVADYNSNSVLKILSYTESSSVVSANAIANAYSTVNITLSYYRNNSDSKTGYEFFANFTTADDALYYPSVTLTKIGEVDDVEEDREPDDGKMRKAMVTGLVLLIILLVLLLISGIILCCTRKKDEEEIPNFFSAEPPNEVMRDNKA